jgi:hypothetical protein
MLQQADSFRHQLGENRGMSPPCRQSERDPPPRRFTSDEVFHQVGCLVPALSMGFLVSASTVARSEAEHEKSGHGDSYAEHSRGQLCRE